MVYKCIQRFYTMVIFTIWIVTHLAFFLPMICGMIIHEVGDPMTKCSDSPSSPWEVLQHPGKCPWAARVCYGIPMDSYGIPMDSW